MLYDLYAAGFWLLAIVGVPLLLSELRDARTDTGIERGDRLRLQGEKTVWMRATRRGLDEKKAARLLEAMAEPKAPKALPAGPRQSGAVPELEPGVFADIEAGVIDRPYESAQTVEAPLPKPEPGQVFPRRKPRPNPRRRLVNPLDPAHAAFRPTLPAWPGTPKENAHAR